MITISDVAREAEVSVSTASRALNGSTMVSPEKRARISRAVEKLGYVPIRTTAARRAQQNRIIFVVVNTDVWGLIDPVCSAIENLGCQPVIRTVGEDGDTDRYINVLNFIKMIPRPLIYGIITVHNTCSNDAVWKEFCKYPLVQIGETKPMTPMTCVSIDDYEAAYHMTSHLIERGRKHIAYVNASDLIVKYNYVKPRFNGFCDAMSAAGREIDNGLIFEADYTFESGVELARKILNLSRRPDSVFCSSDHTAIGCMLELQKHGVRIPDDISVCGFDNIESSEYCTPSLTTIAQPYEEIANEAVQLLESLILNQITNGRRVYTSHTLMIREST